MPKPTYVKHDRISLKEHADFDERWLQDLITKDPAILGLPGDPVVLDREHKQERAGRLDLLLHDQEAERRFELELMLGSLDESHIIRTIEYWDIERRRYPAYDHIAVVVAEDVTGRFLNILSLLAGTIPLIVLQCHALQVDGNLVLTFVKVLDQTSLRRDDEQEARVEPATREDWIERVGEAVLGVSDRALAIMNAKAKAPMRLNYLRNYIGIHDGHRNGLFVHFIPKKKFVHLKVTVQDVDGWVHRLDEAGLDARASKSGYAVRVTLDPQEFDKSAALLTELLHTAVTEYEA